MNLKQHLIATGAASAALLPFGDTTGILLFACGSILIDVDHQIFYYYKTGKCDVSGMFRYFRDVVDQNLYTIPYLGVCIFHTIEFFLLVALLSYYIPPLKYLLAGLIFHILLDIYDLVRLKVPYIRAYSLIEHLIRKRQKGYPFI
ncbi:MAG TPA: hypothetical protein VN652_06290 [Geobacteraceae bacterium]|nr:hypothetical protein [Geobacteraceae bacterium]